MEYRGKLGQVVARTPSADPYPGHPNNCPPFSKCSSPTP